MKSKEIEMAEEEKIDWTSGEIGNMWNIFMANSMAVCMFKHFLLNVEDDEIKDCLVAADKLSKKILADVVGFFEQEGATVPKGFSDEDVNTCAGRLFSDSSTLTILI
jgi:hypothetical protein